MQAFYCDHFVLPLPEGHRFPMRKYALVREQVISSNVLPAHQLSVPPAASDEQLRLAHTAEYVAKVTQGALSEKEIRRIGFPWSPELVERSRRSVGGTIAACRSALNAGVSVNLAGGTHHAHPDFGSGFCVFNDAAVAARTLLKETAVRRVVIIDLDVHQGDGTAAILRGDQAVFTLSLHARQNFPFHKMTSDLDVALDDQATNEIYLTALETALETAFYSGPYDLAIYLAGADPFADDRLGRLSLTKPGLIARDRMVFTACQQRALPVAVVMAGGYARHIQDIVDIHVNTIRTAVSFAIPLRS